MYGCGGGKCRGQCAEDDSVTRLSLIRLQSLLKGDPLLPPHRVSSRGGNCYPQGFLLPLT